MEGFAATGGSEDLTTKCKRALKQIIERLTYLPALDSLLLDPHIPGEGEGLGRFGASEQRCLSGTFVSGSSKG